MSTLLLARTSVETLIADLIAADDPQICEEIIASHPVGPDEARAAVLALVDAAESMLGATPARMEQIVVAALALASAAGDQLAWAMARMRQGDACRVLGRAREAIVCYDEAAAVFTRLGYPVEAARTRIGWVPATAGSGRPDEALRAAGRARRVLLRHGERQRAASLDLNTGNIHWGEGRYRAALQSYTRALALFRSLPQPPVLRIARCHANRGMTLIHLGRHEEALHELQAARHAYLDAGESAGLARLLSGFGRAQMERGRYTTALRAYQEAQSGFFELGLDTEIDLLALDLADCYLSLNQPREALAVIARSEQPDLEPEDITRVLGLGVRRVAAYMALGQWDEALQTIDDIDQRYPSGAIQHRAWLSTQRAAMLLRRGDSAEALAAARRAERLARGGGIRLRMAEALTIQAAALLAAGDVEQAARPAARALTLAHRLNLTPLLHRVSELHGRLDEARGRPEHARNWYSKAITHLEREQRGVIFDFRDGFIADRGAAYERLAVLQIQAGQAEQALSTAERAKSRALYEAIAGSIDIQPRRGAPAAVRRLAEQLARTREEYALLAGQGGHDVALTALEERIVDLVRGLQLAATTDDQSDLYGAPPRVKRSPIPPATVVVEFFGHGDDVIRFICTAAGVRGKLLAGVMPAIERLLRAFRLNLDAAQRSGGQPSEGLLHQARRVLARLHDRLLADVDLTGCRSLVVVPHGLLHYLPFHALHDGSRYLIERLAVSYAPSLALYDICRSRVRRRGRDALVLAHSAGGQVPSTVEEGRAVAAVLATPVHLEAAATRALIQSSGQTAAIIHLAAHGWFRADAPLFSGIQLADGPLTTADIFSLDLRAMLVTLSACETGRAAIGGGDELVGLTRAFLYAGAASLLVSQWRVEDRATTTLMIDLYTALAGGATTAEALRSAQIACLSPESRENDRRHPFFWAGFQLIGDGRSKQPRPRPAGSTRGSRTTDGANHSEGSIIGDELSPNAGGAL